MTYTHLTARERAGLYFMHQYGFSLREIGRRLNRSHSTLSRELKRNSRPHDWCYCDKAAQGYANKRKSTPNHQQVFACLLLQQYVIRKLKLGWSPETIAGRMVLDFPS